jgi:outer membrane protein OmpA-like peptidoglycan-associated protein
VKIVLRGAAVVLVGSLGACATQLASTLPAPAPAATFVGTTPPGLAAEAVESALAGEQAELERRLSAQAWTVPVQIGRTPEGFLRVRFGADESFAPDDAQLQASALLPYTETAGVLKQWPATVIHVLAHGAEGQADEPSTDLTARRAASVLSYLGSRGLPPTRLRAEGRGPREPLAIERGDAANRRVELVVRPVIAGREREAWMPPAPDAACEPCNEAQ